MALFQFNDRIIPYHIQSAPFGFDLILLQGSQHTEDIWQPVLESICEGKKSSGRVLTCDWAAKPTQSEVSDERIAIDFVRLIQTLGITGARIVAIEDAVEVVAEAQRRHPGLFDKTLFFPQGGPKGDLLTQAIREHLSPSAAE